MTTDSRFRHPLALSAWCVIVFVVAAAAALGLGLSAGPSFPAMAIMALAALCAFAENMAVTLPNGSSVSATAMLALAAACVTRSSAPLLGPLLVGMAAGLYWPHLVHLDMRRVAMNMGMFGLSALGAAAAFDLVTVPTSSPGTQFLGAMVGAAAFWVTNITLLAVALRLRDGTPVTSHLAELFGFPALEIVVFAMLGVFLGQLYVSFGAWTLALCVTPVIVAREAFMAYQTTRESHEGILEVLVRALESKDPYTGGHVERVAKYSRYIGSELKFSLVRLRRLHDAALMHDIGKLTVPNQLLNKPGKLTAAEFARVQLHEDVSVELLRRIDELAPCATTVMHSGLEGPLESRIIHVADAFDAMTSTRAYRRALAHDDAIGELRANAGRQFDADCVEGLIAALERTGERFGAGIESEEAIEHFSVAPPVAGFGSGGLGDLAPDPTPTEGEAPPPTGAGNVSHPARTVST